MALILASASAVRRQMLDAAGVEYRAIPSSVDEAALKMAGGGAAAMAIALAGAKAEAVGRDRPGDWVIGSDSIVSVEGRPFDKPRSREDAAEHLRVFSGRSMRLTSAVALARGTQVEWEQIDEATLQVRPLSEKFIEAYLEAEWPEVGHCVGVFRLEGRGVQLFDGIDGNYFTILGMPLLPLLGALRARALIAA